MSIGLTYRDNPACCVNHLPNIRVVGEPDAEPTAIPESVIHEIWRLQHFRTEDMQTVDGQRLVVLDPGRLNDDQGPDFLDSRLLIGSTTWAGAVEIHRTSSDWMKHGHNKDPHYHPVILHVTLMADRETGRLMRSDQTVIPEFVLYPRLKESLRKLQWKFKKGGKLFFACGDHWMGVPDPIIAPFLDRLAHDRLKGKAHRLGERFLEMPDLDQILYEEVFRSLGYIQNAEAMVLLARRVPLRLLRRLSDPRDAVALLLGAGGLLEEVLEDLSVAGTREDLVNRYTEMRAGESPPRLPRTIWRNSRLRPANNPQRRILQGALLFGPGGSLRERTVDDILQMFESNDPKRVLMTLLDIPRDVAAYVRLEKPGDGLRLGLDRCTTVAANAILPCLLLHIEQIEYSDGEARMMTILRKLPVVMDRIVRRYSVDRGRPTSASVAQGLHELSRSWCGQGKCRSCPIWRHIASREQ